MLEPLNELGFVQRQIVQRSDERHHDKFVRVLTFANANEKLPDKKKRRPVPDAALANTIGDA